MFQKCLTSIDIYGTSLKFTLFDNLKYQTSCGGFLTILTGILFFLCYYYFGQDFYNRTNPHYLNQKITMKNYPVYSLNSDDLFIAIRLEDNNGNYFNNSKYLDIEYNLINVWTDSSGNFQSTSFPLEFIDCSLINLTKMRMQITKNISDMSCIKFDNTNLGGYWESNSLNYIKVIYSPCINNTKNGNSCLDPYKAAETLDSQMISFNIYTNVYYTDLNDYANPLKSNLYNIYSYVDSQSTKNMKLFFRSANISTDLNYLVHSPKKYSLFGMENFMIDILKVNPSFENATNDTKIALIEIYFSKNIETFNVAYIKLQEILATLGGILSIVSVILKNTASFFNIHYRNLEIFNELFNFNDFKNEEKLNTILKEKLYIKKLKKTKTIVENNASKIIQSTEILSNRELIERSDPPFFSKKTRREILYASIENSELKGKFSNNTRN